ncbi:extradiol dioxygenase [Paenibacillus helianthi]|uniref:Extradiol dioxygenase n=1 Tax=Paenibacillus helianthi TaxID=1349432 RepID=A0ABX3EG62_9BACL|nr:VOC family protein [Paenibacillus helianthi]OKP81474.1 extradiol dioxygenase [Paenibacillus helianthi]
MGFQAGQLFVNLPVNDLQASINFFTAFGFGFNSHFTDENATCMILNDITFVMLLTKEFFKTFVSKEIVDTSSHTEVILAFSASSREEVHELVDKALAAGGKKYNDPIDHGFMYSWSFQDIDGHLWESVYMEEGTPEQA